MFAIIFFALLISLLIIHVLNLPVFGQKPNGNRLAKINSLPNYKSNSIENQSLTPAFADGVNIFTVLKKLIKGNSASTPRTELPHVRPDFDRSEELKLTWFGHSSYLIQLNNKNILVDPIFSKRTSPFQFLGTKNFRGTDFIYAEDLPNLDAVLITHDHYDHLDYQTILKLKNKTAQFITSLGVGAHLEKWGIMTTQLTELAWGDIYSPWLNLTLTATPARHFSGRKFKRNQTLWSSFVLKTGQYSIFIGGDSGYDQHFKEIGEMHGPFDLAILECGQYDKMWPLIHMFPEEVVNASIDLNAKILLPVHWGKYKLALHDWNEPIINLVKIAEEKCVKVITPQLGETFSLEKSLPQSKWWLNL